MNDLEKAQALAKRFAIALAKMLGKTVDEINALGDKETASADLLTLHSTKINSMIEEAEKDGKSEIKGMVSRGLKKLGYDKPIEKFNAEFWNDLTDVLSEKYKAENGGDDDDDNDGKDKGGKGKADDSSAVKTLKAEIATLKAANKKLTEDHETAIEGLKNDHDRDLRYVKVEQIARNLLVEGKAAIPADEAVAQAKFNSLMRELKDYDYRLNKTTNEWELIDKETGKVVREDSQNLTLNNKMSSMIDVHYGRATSTQQKSNGLPNDKQDANPSGGGGGNAFKFEKFTGAVPKSQADVFKLLDAKTPLPFDQQSELNAFLVANPNLPETTPAE